MLVWGVCNDLVYIIFLEALPKKRSVQTYWGYKSNYHREEDSDFEISM